MVFFRNIQLRWIPLKGEHEVVVALERLARRNGVPCLPERLCQALQVRDEKA
jgi:hypothetical protein